MFSYITAIPRPKSTFSLAKAHDQQEQLLQETLQEMQQDQFVCSKVLQYSQPIKEFTDKCVAQLQKITPSMIVHFSACLTLLWPAIESADKHSQETSRRQSIFSKAFQIRGTDAYKNAAFAFFTKLGNVTHLPHMFLQVFSRLLVDKLAVRHEQVEASAGNERDQQKKLTNEEENIIRYVGGYVVFKLPRKVYKVANAEDLTKLMTEGKGMETKLSYTNEWTSLQNRGGLCFINDITFLFFCELELIVRNKFPSTTQDLRDLDLRSSIMETCLTSQRLLHLWGEIVRNSIQEGKSLQLFQLVCDFFIQVRYFAFARDIREKFKLKEKQNTLGQKGLRSGLNGCTS